MHERIPGDHIFPDKKILMLSFTHFDLKIAFKNFNAFMIAEA